MEVPLTGESSLKVPVVVRADYTLLLERFGDRTWVHCDVHHWSPRCRSGIGADLRRLCDMQGAPLYAFHDPADDKHRRFVAIYHFTHDFDVRDPAGRLWEVFKYT